MGEIPRNQAEHPMMARRSHDDAARQRAVRTLRQRLLPKLAAGSREWVSWHLIGGIGLAAVIAWCFQAQLPAIRGQHELIDEVMVGVRRERAARGLDVAG